MDYLKLYNKLTSLKNKTNEYCELHHIIPRCLGGSDDPSNLIMLTARQHFIAHKLLIKIYPDNHLLHHAFAMMASTNRYQSRSYTSKQYDEMKSSRSLAMKLDNPMRNEDVVNKMSQTRKDLFSKGLLPNPMDSLEARKKASDRMKKNNPMKKFPEKNPFLGKSYVVGRKWYNNGIENKYLFDNEVIPEGFVKGMVYKARKKRVRDN